jgi:hypothetical protein
MRKSAHGQAIAEGSVSILLMVLLGLAIVLFMIKIGLGVMYQEKLNLIAATAAEHISSGNYWLGMILPDEDAQRANRVTEAQALANNMLTKLGLPQYANASWNDDTQEYQLNVANATPTNSTSSSSSSGSSSSSSSSSSSNSTGTGQADVTTVSFDVNGLSTITGTSNVWTIPLIFDLFSLHAVGISSKSIAPAYGTCTLHFRDDNVTGGAMRNIRVPIYFEGIAHDPTDHIIPKGKFIGNPIHAYVVVDAVTKKTDPAHPSIDSEYGGDPTYWYDEWGTPILPWWGYGYVGGPMNPTD